MDDKVAGHSQIQTGSCCRANLGFGFNYILFTFLMINTPCFHFRQGDQSFPFFYRLRCEGSDIAIRDSGSNPASKQRAMAIQAVLIQRYVTYVLLA